MRYREDDRRIMTRRESEAMDRHITGNYGEDSEQAQDFDRAFSKEDDTLVLLKRILTAFDLDICVEGSVFTGFRYTGRLWEEGGVVCKCGPDSDLAQVLQDLDRNAEVIVSAYNS